MKNGKNLCVSAGDYIGHIFQIVIITQISKENPRYVLLGSYIYLCYETKL